MATRIFDRETLLDLIVNAIPLFIIAFFVAGFLVFNPFGVDPLASGIQFALLLAPAVALAVLSYYSARAISSTEKSSPVYLPGQATVAGARTVHERERDEAAGGDVDAGGEPDDAGSPPDESASEEGEEAHGEDVADDEGEAEGEPEDAAGGDGQGASTAEAAEADGTDDEEG